MVKISILLLLALTLAAYKLPIISTLSFGATSTVEELTNNPEHLLSVVTMCAQKASQGYDLNREECHNASKAENAIGHKTLAGITY